MGSTRLRKFLSLLLDDTGVAPQAASFKLMKALRNGSCNKEIKEVSKDNLRIHARIAMLHVSLVIEYRIIKECIEVEIQNLTTCGSNEYHEGRYSSTFFDADNRHVTHNIKI